MKEMLLRYSDYDLIIDCHITPRISGAGFAGVRLHALVMFNLLGAHNDHIFRG